ncbi:tRNA-splicing endonuclease subunit Sen54-like isoform X1 [Quercus lobata]|uniref:tRNA-splicing endonuclease subunit Sen54 N-terminal domain-containing protein n=2 Tax=Quercus lobata TaxID=97700 RepID=A0A7N2MXQ3_QUELO|nr:tRNA-splicing endonuclease subunit Sen54-like isoform X1 [Quercus lobata]XP_030945134.1 tRNA-splicing endonuclease subunit Sen54-like isoform X1 [Quercus lobata]
MEAVDWENSSGVSSDTEEYLQDTKYEDDEELHFTSGFISKLQFRKDKSRAHWINEMGMAEVVENKGKLWRTMGVVRSGKIYYSIEETLFLMEIGALLLLDDNGTSLSLNDIYAKVSGGSWELFEVYRHLKSLGYIVGRHGIAWSIKGAKSNCQSVSLQCSPQSSEVVNLESEDESSIVGSFNNMHINEARPVFDVYLPDSKFRKSSPGDPSFVICLTRGDLPSIADIEVLERQCGAIPLRFCHVEYGRVSFFSFNEEELPILP